MKTTLVGVSESTNEDIIKKILEACSMVRRSPGVFTGPIFGHNSLKALAGETPGVNDELLMQIVNPIK